MSEEQSQNDELSAIPESPANPEDVSSAARSCSVILVIMAAFAVILCVWVAIIIFR
jgi:hypothetical protein